MSETTERSRQGKDVGTDVPPVGAMAVDMRDSKVGEVMGMEGGRMLLRPVKGGKEWEVPPGAVRRATAHEVLHAHQATADPQSWRLGWAH